MELNQSFVKILEKFNLPEAVYFELDNEIVHKALNLIFKAQLQIQPEICWSNLYCMDELSILKTNLDIDLLFALNNRYNDNFHQIGHPLNSLLYRCLMLIEESPELFDTFVSQNEETYDLDLLDIKTNHFQFGLI